MHFFGFCLVALKCSLPSSKLYKRPCPSVGRLVRWSVGPLVGNAFVSVGGDKPANDLLYDNNNAAIQKVFWTVSLLLGVPQGPCMCDL